LVRRAAAGSSAGIFGPHSLTWRVDREVANFLGAGRALLLQLAHPWVASAIEQHSNAFADPIARFHRTFGTVYTMVFGTLEASLDAARSLHRRHAMIRGRLAVTVGPFLEGSLYFANSIPALLWVYATLIDTALITHDLVLPPLTPEAREQYIAESRLFAALFGIPPKSLPGTWAEFTAYRDGILRSQTLTVTESAQKMAHRLLGRSEVWFPIPASYRALTAQILPLSLREAFALPFGENERRAAGQLVARIRRVYPFLPAALRYVGPYLEARGRLAGKHRPNFMTRASNRFWIGRPRLIPA
jgi:uncharacterized protein (DUF2236 family)